MWAAITSFASKLFVGEKGIIDQASDVVDKWHPSKTTIHTMNIEDQKAGDASQESARAMVVVSHDSWFDIIIDAWARLPRPALATWTFGMLVGWFDQPEHINEFNPIILNIIWTVITFYFGSRVIVKDIPAAIALAVNAVKKFKS